MLLSLGSDGSSRRSLQVTALRTSSISGLIKALKALCDDYQRSRVAPITVQDGLNIPLDVATAFYLLTPALSPLVPIHRFRRLRPIRIEVVPLASAVDKS
jgi:hypothetical protein